MVFSEKFTHIDGDFIGMKIIHPQNRYHCLNVEERYHQLNPFLCWLSLRGEIKE